MEKEKKKEPKVNMGKVEKNSKNKTFYVFMTIFPIVCVIFITCCAIVFWRP